MTSASESVVGTDVVVSVAAFVGTLLLFTRTARRSDEDGSLAVLITRTAKDSSYDAATTITKDQVLRARRRYFSSAQSVSYLNSDPLMIVKGRGCYLYNEKGEAYLDTRNNVAHVGHCHPRVVLAVQEQVARVNTNTRYLHPTTTCLAERLVQLFPDSLDVVFFCNSGSEANDLALRLARACRPEHSTNTIVVDHAYHGHTLATLQASPYKYEHGTEFPLMEKGDADENDSIPQRVGHGGHVYKVPCPDTFRGLYRDPYTAGRQYAALVENACRYFQQGSAGVSAMIVEGGMSVAGVILPPRGYLKACVEAVHHAGGLYIADEVQTGFGRLGKCMWAFEYSYDDDENDEDAVVPDIVTVGKPFGNGMSLAAVVTSRKVAAAFEACGVEYFNTFGGNPVCAAAGLAVLNILQEEGLQQKALQVGSYLFDGFRKLQNRILLIGDVRGSGLFLGVELVRNRETLEPADMETSFVCSLLKSKHHILTSIDGPHENVVVIKPPMALSKTDADCLLKCFESVVTIDLPAADVTNMSKTPT